jgi:tRNA-dihydrouridine synthase B
MVVSEMVTSQLDLRHSTKSKFRLDLSGEPEPVVVQIVGTDPQTLAEAARFNVANGAQIIDINMGCPAKKVCKKAAGSALLADPSLVADILKTVVNAVDVPVTVKIRTGVSPEQRNAPEIAKIAEGAGVAALTIHGRTKECKFVGQVEYDSIASVKQAVKIPIIANGDIDSPNAAARILDYTKADAVMVGRAAQGQPWLLQQIVDHLAGNPVSPPPSHIGRAKIILDHLAAIHAFYGDSLGVRLARKHIKWYLIHWHEGIAEHDRLAINCTEDPIVQHSLMQRFLHRSLAQIAA